jgi:hypothetical protein
LTRWAIITSLTRNLLNGVSSRSNRHKISTVRNAPSPQNGKKSPPQTTSELIKNLNDLRRCNTYLIKCGIFVPFKLVPLLMSCVTRTIMGAIVYSLHLNTRTLEKCTQPMIFLDTYILDQGCANCGPRTRSTPLELLIRPAEIL